MLAAGFTGLSQIEEDASRPVNAVTGFIGGPDQPKQACVLVRPVGQRIFQPCVEAAGANLQSTAHGLYLKLATMNLDEFVDPTSGPGAGSAGHLWTLWLSFTPFYGVHEILGTPVVTVRPAPPRSPQEHSGILKIAGDSSHRCGEPSRTTSSGGTVAAPTPAPTRTSASREGPRAPQPGLTAHDRS